MDENNITQEDLQELGYTDSQIGSVGDLKSEPEVPETPEVPDAAPDPAPDPEPSQTPETPDPAPEAPAGQTAPVQVPETPSPAPTAAELAEQVRAISQKESEEYNVVQQEIFKKLYKEVDTKVRGAQGEEIGSAQELLNYINPATGEAYTQEEANAWFNQAKAGKQEEARKIVQTSEHLAKVNYSVNKGAEKVQSKYADLLKSDPQMAQKIYDGYLSTLKVDPETGIILEAPVPITDYYDNALSGFTAVKSQEQAFKSQIEEMKQVVEDYKKQLEEVKNKQALSDRSDIFGVDNSDSRSDEERNLDKTMKEYYKEQGINL